MNFLFLSLFFSHVKAKVHKPKRGARVSNLKLRFSWHSSSFIYAHKRTTSSFELLERNFRHSWSLAVSEVLLQKEKFSSYKKKMGIVSQHRAKAIYRKRVKNPMRNIRNERQLATLVLLAIVVYISASVCCFSMPERHTAAIAATLTIGPTFLP